jgi:hypothetical protein
MQTEPAGIPVGQMKERQVMHQIKEFQKVADEVGCKVKELEMRLEGVLVCMPPSPPTTTEKEFEPNIVFLAQEILCGLNLLHEINNTINSILNRYENKMFVY